MHVVNILINMLMFTCSWSREFGLFFEDEEAYFQTSYVALCNESRIKFDVLINRSSGVVLYAENKVRAVNLIVYFERPGMYINVTDGNIKYNVPLTLDFFSNQWFGWHEIELRLTEYKMHLVFDSTERQIALHGGHLFPEDVIEDNDIYFGASPTWSEVGNVTRFSGFMKNLGYRSCGCEQWKPIKILRTVKISLDYLGECGSINACARDCLCYLFTWGVKRCECPTDVCSHSSDAVSFSFNKVTSTLERLQPVNRQNGQFSESGPFGNSMDIKEGNALILYVAKGRSCFRNIFLCENGFAYSFWILPKVVPERERSLLILRHSSTVASTHGLTVTRTMDHIDVSLTTRDGSTIVTRSSMTLAVWSCVTIYYNMTHISLHVNSRQSQSSSRFIKTTQNVSDILSTRFLFIGDNRDDTSLSIANLMFSTDLYSPDLSSLQELRLEQHNNLRKANTDCNIHVENSLVDLSSCYHRTFGDGNLTQFHLSFVGNMTCDKQSVVVRSSFIDIVIEPVNVLVIDVHGVWTERIRLNDTAHQVKYVEISVNSNGAVLVVQNMDIVLVNATVNMAKVGYQSTVTRFRVNSDYKVLRNLRIINTDRDFSARALRILTERIERYSVDFENSAIDQYKSLHLTNGYVDHGVLLKYPTLHISANWLNGSCIRYLVSCYHGLTVSFWIKRLIKFQDNKLQEHLQLFSSGVNGISLVVGISGTYFLLTTGPREITKFDASANTFSLDKWTLVEMTVSQNRVPSLYINRQETQRMEYTGAHFFTQCKDLCLGDYVSKDTSVSIILDELHAWDVDRMFLYANGYISQGLSGYNLLSFTNYQLNKSFTLHGSAKIISTKYGFALGLNNFGPRFATVNLKDSPKCFSNPNYCRRGLMIRVWLRPDNLAISHQILLASPFVTVSINLEYLTIHYRVLGRSWFLISKYLLQLFVWQVIDISWHPDGGLKAHINGRLTGHSRNYSDNNLVMSRTTPPISVGIDHSNTWKINYATVLIDDIEFFDADRTNLAYETIGNNDTLCATLFNFDENSSTEILTLLGIVGNAGLFKDSNRGLVRFPIPKCFSNPITECKMCFTLRFWLNIHKLNVTVFESGYVTLAVAINEIRIEIGGVTTGRVMHFSCQYWELVMLNKWKFIEVSWHHDEGLLVFVNREGIPCHLTLLSDSDVRSRDSVDISKHFVGAIDEIEMYHSRISLLYRSKVLDESKTLEIIAKIRKKERMQKEVLLLKMALNSATENRSVEVVDSFQFNGSNYVSYKLPKTSYAYIPGGREEVEISFKSFNSAQNSIIWVSDSMFCKNTLTLKNRKLYFTKVYVLPSTNTSKRLTEELEIYNNILPNVLYNVAIYQRAGEIVLKTTTLNASNIQSMIGRDALLPMDSDVYFGGYSNVNFLKSNQIDSSLSGVIYKARFKASSNEKAVDIFQEMPISRSKPNIINHGNVIVVKKIVKPNILQKTSFLATLSRTEIPLMINSPFLSLNLPKWDFNLLASIEIQFSTLESRGQIIFIGNTTDFISLEIFDSHLFFNYKRNDIFKRIRTHSDRITINDNRAHKVNLGRDLSGNIKVYFNRDEVVNEPMKLEEFENSVTVIGHLETYDKWPHQILSRISFVGCIHFIKINDEEYINFFGKSDLMRYNRITLYQDQTNMPIKSAICATPSLASCDNSPCDGGWCQLTFNSKTGQSSNNFKCNCLYSSKSLDISFTGHSPVDNYNLWVYEYLLQSRSKSCSQETKQLAIIDQSFFVVNFQLTFPFTAVMDLEFLVLLRSRYNCVMDISLGQSTMYVLVNDGQFHINISHSNIVLFPDMNLFDNQWHGIHIQVRLHSVRVAIGNVHKEFTSSLIPVLIVSKVKVGNCADYRQSNFKIKGLSYNNLNLLSTASPIKKAVMFFTATYHYPTITELDNKRIISLPTDPVTFLNNFQYAITTRPLRMTWFTQFHLSLASQYPGVIFHLLSGPKVLSCVLCPNNVVIILHKDHSEKLRTERVTFNDASIKFTLTIDLIRETVKFTRFGSPSGDKVLSLAINSWNIDDDVYVHFGVNNSYYEMIGFQDLDTEERKCLENNLRTSVVGCFDSLVWSDGNRNLVFSKEWNSLMKIRPQDSVMVGQCKSVDKCHSQTCQNGVCKSRDRYSTFCDCSNTDFVGPRCQEMKDKCSTYICQNNGQCISTKDYNGNYLTYCNCSGTGFTGKNCEELLCPDNYCSNNGRCYSSGNTLYCDCETTKYTGPKCQTPHCGVSTCNGHGACQIIFNYSSPVCHCRLGYFGEYCQETHAHKCETICKNGGVCSSYNPIFKLCSNKYCQHWNTFRCNCDHTFYSGGMCEQAERGLRPLEDGVVLMENVSVIDQNYLRILFETHRQGNKTTLITILKSVDERLAIYLVDQTLAMEYNNRLSRVSFTKPLGQVAPKNVLVLMESNSRIDFYLNNKIENIRFKELEIKFNRRNKRSVPVKDLSYPAIIVGCGDDMLNCFDGLIAGLKWNDRLLLDQRNLLLKNGQLRPIAKLQVRSFPTQTPFIMFHAATDDRVTAVVVVGVLLVFLFAFYVARRIWSRSFLVKNVYVNDTKDPMLEMDIIESNEIKEDFTVPEYSPGLSSQYNHESRLTVKSISSSVSSELEYCRILVIKSIESVHRLTIIDYTPVPANQIVIVVNYLPELMISQSLFPLDADDLLYKCVEINISPSGHYIYCYMTSLQSSNRDDEFEIQAWKINSTYDLLIRPPTVPFTHSVTFPDESYQILLFNNVTFTITLLEIEISTVLWTNTITNSYPTLIEPMLVLEGTGNLVINRELFFEVYDINDGKPVSTHEAPLKACLKQISDTGSKKLIILTGNHDLYHWDVTSGVYDHKQLPLQVTMICRTTNRSLNKIAFGMETGEVYLSLDDDGDEYMMLGPQNDKNILCMKFSLDGALLAAVFDNNLVHVWRLESDLPLCHFHAVHERGEVIDLDFSSDNRKLIVLVTINRNRLRKNKKILIMNTNYSYN